MKECSREKVLKGSQSEYDPPTHEGGPGGQQYKGYWVVLHDQGEEYQQPITFSPALLTHYTSLSCPESNPIKDKIPVLGLDIVERQV